VNALKLKLFPQEKAAVLKHYTANADAYQLYLKGRYYLNKWTAGGLRNAIEYFTNTILLEPGFAPAYSGLADCYGSISCEMLSISPREAAPQARAAALKALEIDESLAEAHTSLALVNLNYEWDFTGAERGLRRAIELNPQYIAAHHWLSHCLIVNGNIDESLVVSKRALELAPLDIEINAHLAWHYCHSREFDLAIEQCKTTVEMEPGFHEAHWFYGWAYEQKGMYSEAIDQFEKALENSGGSPRMKGELGHALALAGNHVSAILLAEELQELSLKQYVSPYNIALVYAGLRDHDKAFEWLEMAYEDRSAMLIYIRKQAGFDGVRDDTRFKDLLKRMDLPE
jgi:tetratricopeptide (TPR) repeat protein